jgi:hypothetical protein
MFCLLDLLVPVPVMVVPDQQLDKCSSIVTQRKQGAAPRFWVLRDGFMVCIFTEWQLSTIQCCFYFYLSSGEITVHYF